MILRISIWMNALVFLVLIPFLEISPTHVFNPDWPAHARLHEVWQLITNAILSLLSIWLMWRAHSPRIAGFMVLSITLGFLGASAMAQSYGGGMVHSDGSELLIGGVNPASAIILALTLGVVAGLLREGSDKK